MIPRRPAPPIVLRGCRQNNLKGFDLAVARGKWTSISGVSGSGKSSLAFDTLYAEGQRRYVESFSAYARQFLERMARPQLEGVEGIPPAVAIAQGNDVRTARSTVATVTEIGDFLKIVFARLGVRHCTRCDCPVRRRAAQDVADEILRRSATNGREIQALVGFEPEAVSDAGFEELRESLTRKGFVRAFARGDVVRLSSMAAPAASERWFVVLDRIDVARGARSRLTEALEQGFSHGGGEAVVKLGMEGDVERFDTGLRCAACDLSYSDPRPAEFSFNHPSGACPECSGFGRILALDEGLVVPDRRKSLADGAVKPWTTPATAWERREMKRWCAERGVPIDVPYEQLTKAQREWLWAGEEGGWSKKVWFGIRPWFEWQETRTYKMHVRVLLSRYRSSRVCERCGGARFRPEVLKVRVGEASIADLYRMPIGELARWFEAYRAPPSLESAVEVVLGEVRARLGYLCEVGLDYLTLDRPSKSLSGGEMERVNLTTAVGSRLVNSLFVLDEPSVGLHPRDNDRLIAILRRLVGLGNTVVVVEHDPALLMASDELVDLGPGAGDAGGRIVYQGPPAESIACKVSLTGQWLSGARRMPERRRRPPGREWLRVRGARAHNLKDIDVEIPLRRFVAVTGVSGSGKSSLVEDVLYRGLRRLRGETTAEPGACDGMDGVANVGDVVFVDAAPLGRSGKSIVATACGAYDAIRKVLADLPEARLHRFTPSTFSFNVKGGRCETCEGAGFERVEMQFLADVDLPCSECGGERFRPEVRRVRLKGKTIGEILNLTVSEASEFFGDDDPSIRRRFAPLSAVGLGYLRIGQSVQALSGGEAQRLKLADAIAEDFAGSRESDGGRPRKGKLFLFDEPTTGLHLDDVAKLLETLDRLVDLGHSVLAIEHQVDFIAHADHVLDIGPEAGAGGGRLVVAGTPERVAACAASHTGRYLRDHGIAAADAAAKRSRQRTGVRL